MKNKLKENKKIMLSGGGSGGPVIPLLEIAKELKKIKSDLNFVFVGTDLGPERKMVEDFGGLPFISLPAGKLRRYFSLENFTDIFKIIRAFFKAFPLLMREKPSIIISAGSFCSVPLVYAAMFFRIPVLIHQQDVRAGLANKLMAPVSRTITAVFEKTLADYGPKAILTGNPISFSEKQPDFDDSLNFLFSGERPLLLVVGGGTGASAINDLISDTKNSLLEFCNVIHVTGKNRNNSSLKSKNDDGGKEDEVKTPGTYFSWEFLSHDFLLYIMNHCDLVVSRCGLGTLTEISFLRKASILIPMPRSHQEDNANIFKRAKAALVLSETDLNPETFLTEVRNLLKTPNLLQEYGNKAYGIMQKGSGNKIAKIVLEIIGEGEEK